MSPLSIRLLGSWQTSLNDQPLIGFESDKVRALLAYLAVESDHPHRREALAGLLWPERPEYNARRCLNQALCDLRRVVGDRTASFPLLIVTRQTVQLNPASEHMLDVAAFGALLDTCQQHSHSSLLDCALCLDRLQQALALYEGDFMEGFSVGDSSAFEEWAMLQREDLGQKVMETLRHLADGYERRGALEQALRYARRQVELDPWREEAHRDLMRLLALSGQRSAALAQYEACRRALAEELGVGPQEGTTRLYEQIRDGEIGQAKPRTQERRAPGGAASVEVPFHNLPASLTPLIGREAELAEIQERLQDPGCRLLTLLGLGGMGKTHLAIEAASRVLSARAFPDGVYMVPLVGVQSVDGIVPATAETVGLSFSASAMAGGRGSTPQQQLSDYLRQKRMLLILDNVEHLIEGVGILTDLLQAAPGLKLMVTTRARLNAQGERAIPLEGLAYPAEHPPAGSAPGSRPAGWVEPAGGSIYPAVQLFLTTAQRISPQFEPTAGDLVEIARICRMAQGMPLALILAAGWIETLSPAEIAIEMGKGLGILATDSGDLPARLRSMRTVFDSSWALVDERRREVFRGLSVFRGGFTRQAAQYVTGATLDELMALVNRARLHRTPGGRFEVHELLRQYAQEKLDQTPDSGRSMRDQHCAYYLAFCRQWGTDLKGPRQRTAADEMAAEIDNVRAAWDWAAEQGCAEWLDQAMEGLAHFYDRHMRYSEGEAAFRSAADRLQPASSAHELRVLLKVLMWYGILTEDPQTFRRLAQQCMGLLQRLELTELDVRMEKAFVLRTAGLFMAGPDYARQAKVLEQSLALYRELGDPYEVATTLHLMALRAYFGYGYELAAQRAQESLAIRKAIGDISGMAITTWLLSAVAFSLGQGAEAERLAQQCIAVGQESADQSCVGIGLWMLGCALCLSGRFAEGLSVGERSLALYRDTGDRNGMYLSHEVQCLAQAHLSQYEEAYAHAQEGRGIAQSMGARAYVGRALVCAGMSLVGQGRCASAQQALQEATAIFRETGAVQVELGWSLPILGYAALAVGQTSQARRAVREALQIGDRTRGFFPCIFAIPAVALLLADAGEKERPVELFALASRYPFVAHSGWFEDVAGQKIASLATALPPDRVTAAQERGRARDLQATVAALLSELEEAE